MSPSRFGTLLRSWEDDEIFARNLRRAVSLLRREPFHMYAFTRDILYMKDTVRRRWTYEYWQTEPLSDTDAPTAEAPTSEEINP